MTIQQGPLVISFRINGINKQGVQRVSLHAHEEESFPRLPPRFAKCDQKLGKSLEMWLANSQMSSYLHFLKEC